MSLTQTSFTVRENGSVVVVCAQFTKYNIKRPECPMEGTVYINISTVNNTAGIHVCILSSCNISIYRYMYVCVFMAHSLLMQCFHYIQMAD